MQKTLLHSLVYSMTAKKESHLMATINDMIIQASELRPGISRLLRNSTYPGMAI